MSTTTTTFDLARFTGAIVARDAAPQIDGYAPDATVTIIDRLAQPGSPRVLHGRDEIAHWIEDTAAREMTHAVSSSVAAEDGAAFILRCRYPDGTAVVCATVLELAGGAIAAQTVVQAWDEQ